MNRGTRILLGGSSLAGLLCIYLFQHSDLMSGILPSDSTLYFITAKSLRFLANDFLMLGVLMSLFPGRTYLTVALLVQLFGAVFLLIPYFILILVFKMDNGPLTSFLHRLVLNPTLMILLIPGFYLIRRNSGSSPS